MKIICLLTAFLFVGATLNAQDDDINYLFKKKKDYKIGGFLSPGAQVGMLDGDIAGSNGFGGALLINNTFFIGAYGQSVATSHRYDSTIYIKSVDTEGNMTGIVPYNKQYTNFSYGSMWVGYIFMPKNAIHFGVSAKVGVGTVSVTPKWDEDWSMNDIVGVFSPQAELEMNLTRWMKLNVGVGYQYVFDVDKKYAATADKIDNPDTPLFDSNDFNSPYGSLNLIFMFSEFKPHKKKEDKK